MTRSHSVLIAILVLAAGAFSAQAASPLAAAQVMLLPEAGSSAAPVWLVYDGAGGEGGEGAGGSGAGDSNGRRLVIPRTPRPEQRRIRSQPPRGRVVRRAPRRVEERRTRRTVRRSRRAAIVLPTRNIPVPTFRDGYDGGQRPGGGEQRRDGTIIAALPRCFEGSAGGGRCRLANASIPVPSPRPGPGIVVAGRDLSGDIVPREILVTVADAAAAQAIGEAQNLQLLSARPSQLLGATIARYAIADDRPVAAVLAVLRGDARAGVAAVNGVYRLQQDVPHYAFSRIALEPAGASGTGVRVAVIDTAADADHPALDGVIAERFDALDGAPARSRSHATSVITLLAGNGPFRGAAPGAAVLHARAFEQGRSSADLLLQALDWAAQREAQVVNMSFAGARNALFEIATSHARARGIVLVAAAGNEGPGAPYAYPAAYRSVIAVTASDARDRIMGRANRGPYIHVAAPGVDLLAPVEGGMDFVTGTSMASAVASGAIAAILAGNRTADADWIERALAETAVDLGAEGHDEVSGHGLINVRAVATLN